MSLSPGIGLLPAVFFCFVIWTVAGNDLPMPTRNASDYRLQYRDPSGCTPDNCTYFVGIDTNTENESFLDFYLVGITDGWVAIGFTKTDSMRLADVLGCSIHDRRFPLIIDSQNLEKQKVNRLDESEINGRANDVIEYSVNYTDGRIICTFSRSIEGIDPYPQDLPLNTGYYFQFGLGQKSRGTQNLTHFSYHEGSTPKLTTKKYNPSTDSGQITISNLRGRLIAAHGILMLVAWPILSFTAILFATWMKPALPNGQWFQVHRAFNLAGLLVGVVAFVLVFIAHKDKPTPGLIDLGTINQFGTAHFALGILIMALQLANPVISTCRCKPDHKFRWMFFLLHGLIIGYGLLILAYVNAGIGVHIYGEGRTDFGNLTLLWIYVGFAAFSLVLACVLFAVFTGEAIIYKRDALSIAPSVVKMFLKWCNKYTELTHSPPHVEMTVSASYTANTQVVSTTDPLTKSPAQGPKVASRDAPIRWLGMVAFLLVTVPAIITIIVLMILRMN